MSRKIIFFKLIIWVRKVTLKKKNNVESEKREKRIIKQLNLKKLPFKISADNFCDIYISLIQDLRETFQYQSGNPGMIWCLSTIKKFKVFLLIFEANEIGTEIYKENISNRLPEYSYKMVKGVSKIKVGIIVLKQLNYPTKILNEANQIINKL